jgi:hypothetical protein
MAEPCIQGDRLITLEMILKSMNETLTDQKAISAETYKVLSVISEQGAQLRSITSRVDDNERDLQIAFKSIRRIDLRHAHEDGAEDIVKEHSQFWNGIKQQSTPYAFTVLFFVLWLADKFNVIQFFAGMFKQMKG